MTTTVVSPHLVRVEPDKVGPADVLELAEALIEEYGHTKGNSGGTGTGLSIHGAIGEAARLITTSNDKSDNRSRTLRDQAKALFESHHNKGRDPQTQPAQTEFSLNDDPAVGKDEAIALLREAREAAQA